MRIISHKLSFDLHRSPIRQKRQPYNAKHYEAMKVDVDKLLSIKFIRRMDYPRWVVNVVRERNATVVGKPTPSGACLKELA